MKPHKLKARLPRGLEDRGPAAIAATRAMTDKIREVYERYGFEPVETPAMEYTDALGKFLPDQDRPNEGVFSFQDDDEQWVSLRYDLTAPLARYVAENFQNLALPYRSYRAGYVFRNEKPGPGRFRQFMQFDADTVGSASPAADAEMCMMAADTMEALGIPRGQYVVKVNSRRALNETLAPIPTEKHLTVLRAIDKLDRLGLVGVRQLLGEGRQDESGDFTKGANLASGEAEAVLNFVQRGLLSADLEAILSLTGSCGYGDCICMDPSVVRGLEYYTGAVFELELLGSGLGSVGGGGRYDGLVSRFRGEPVPATGFSIGVSRLQAALTKLGKLDMKPQPGPVVVTVFGPESVLGALQLTAALRAAGVRAEMYLGNPKRGIGQQLKYADRRNSPCAVIQGSDERERGEVLVRDLVAGAAPSGADDRGAHLAKQAESQVAVKVENMVESVVQMLARNAPTGAHFNRF